MNITFEDFKKIEIRIGKVVECEKVEDADKLLKLTVDFGPSAGSGSSRIQRQIISGIAQWYSPEDLKGKKLPFIVNLEPRKFRGHESQGMLVAMDTEDKSVLLIPAEDVKEGTLVV
ncbi:MAG: hypothetical protein COU25_00140 [Candidatus Levybacteria bacterium CG10_big_fil_rev_8_21_14_0_10_35_13]|nr:MAG: hypothetical protein COU25_00140 [Candidatus Levybacteria bacterium CG10_big_fil_rev_8_21_14_0_10_35_13]